MKSQLSTVACGMAAAASAYKQYAKGDPVKRTRLKDFEEAAKVAKSLYKTLPRILQAADCSLADYHRYLWHSNAKTRGGIQRDAVIKTVKAIRKILGTNTPGQSL